MTDGWYRENLKTLYTADQIQNRIRELGAQIAAEYRDRSLVLLCVLKGSFMFAADLARAIDLPLRIEFLGVQSYGDDTASSGVVQITLDYITEVLKTRHPASVKVCALLHKPARVKKQVKIDYLGFTIDDVFVVGYGLDWAQKYRNVPEIGVVRSTSG